MGTEEGEKALQHQIDVSCDSEEIKGQIIGLVQKVAADN